MDKPDACVKTNMGDLWDDDGITSHDIPEGSCCETDVLAR